MISILDHPYNSLPSYNLHFQIIHFWGVHELLNITHLYIYIYSSSSALTHASTFPNGTGTFCDRQVPNENAKVIGSHQSTGDSCLHLINPV